MAKVKLGTTVVGIRGTIAGVTYAKNSAGYYARGYAVGPSGRTDYQAYLSELTSYLVAQWPLLSESQRSAWTAYGQAEPQWRTNSLGLTYKASGINWFVGINLNLLLIERTLRLDAPTNPAPAAPPISSVSLYETGSPSHSTLYYPSGSWTGYDAVIFASSRPGGQFVSPPTRRRPIYYRQNPPADSLDIQSHLESAFGRLVAGQQVWIWAALQTSQGRRGPTSQILGIVE